MESISNLLIPAAIIIFMAIILSKNNKRFASSSEKIDKSILLQEDTLKVLKEIKDLLKK